MSCHDQSYLTLPCRVVLFLALTTVPPTVVTLQPPQLHCLQFGQADRHASRRQPHGSTAAGTDSSRRQLAVLLLVVAVGGCAPSLGASWTWDMGEPQ